MVRFLTIFLILILLSCKESDPVALVYEAKGLPNIVLIISDDQAWTGLQLYGS